MTAKLYAIEGPDGEIDPTTIERVRGHMEAAKECWETQKYGNLGFEIMSALALLEPEGGE